MPTNRPFLANLLVAFRTHTATSKGASSSSPSPSPQSNSKTVPNPTGTVASPASPSPPSVPSSSSSSSSSSSASPSSSTSTTSSLPIQQNVATNARHRRGSSSSMGGNAEPSSGDKWWIGGRNSDGQERFYRLQPLRRQKSYDRLSLDRLSI